MWHNTIGTEVVASVHNRKPTLESFIAEYGDILINSIVIGIAVKYSLAVYQYVVK